MFTRCVVSVLHLTLRGCTGNQEIKQWYLSKMTGVLGAFLELTEGCSTSLGSFFMSSGYLFSQRLVSYSTDTCDATEVHSAHISACIMVPLGC